VGAAVGARPGARPPARRAAMAAHAGGLIKARAAGGTANAREPQVAKGRVEASWGCELSGAPPRAGARCARADTRTRAARRVMLRWRRRA
jgi:hypothetical protein